MSTYSINKIKLPNGDICDISPTWDDIKSKPTISSPNPNGTDTSFIDTITQVNGTISATKKTVPIVTTSENGLMLSDDKEKLDDIDLIKQVKTVSIEPVQDLHGYDHPWPAGGGKNKFALTDGTVVNNGMTLKWQNGVFTIYAPNTTSGEVTAGNSVWKSLGYCTLPAGSYTFYTERPTIAGSMTIYLINYDTGDRIVSGKSTGTFTFTLADETKVYLGFYMLGAKCKTESEWKVGVFLTSEYTGYSPYSNICPISGWTGANVANISDSEKQPYFAGLLNGTYGFVDLGTCDWYSTSVFYYASLPLHKVGIGGNLINACSVFGHVYLQMAGPGNKSYITTDKSNYPNYGDSASFKAAMSGIYLVYELATPTTPIITKEQFELLLDNFRIGGGLITISWQSEAGTVYGGMWNVTTGLMTVKKHKVNLDGTQTMAFYNQTNGVLEIQITEDMDAYSGGAAIPNIMSDKLKTISQSSVWNPASVGAFVSRTGNARKLYIGLMAFAGKTMQQVKDALEDDPIEIVYELATPQTYQLTPTQIFLLAEHKHVWADCGDVTLQSCFTNNAANVTGIVNIDHGGTGATTAADARTNLGLGTMATETAADYLKLSGGTMTGPLKWSDSNALPERTSASYFLAIDAFASGGTTCWVNSSNVKTSLALKKSDVGLGNVANSTYAGGTAVTLNNSSKASSTASFYAPTTGGTADTQALVGNGATSAPKWVNISPSITIGAGTSSAAPTVNVTVLGQSGTAQSITTASTSVYGVTKLNDGIASNSTALAATANSALIAAKKVASSNSTSKLYLVGATSQSTTGVDSYSYQYTYTNNGLLSALKVGLNLNGTEKAHLEWNNTDQSIDFIFE